MDIKYNVTKFKKNQVEEIKDHVSIEEPLEMSLRFKKNNNWQTINLSITMRTPGNDEDLIRGFLFNERIVETGFKKAMKGNWGSQEHTKKVGVVQDLNRLSFNSALSHLRKISLPLDASAKVIGPRLLHPSQWGIIDPVDTPDGGNVGLHKHLALMAYITSSCPSAPMIQWLRLNARVLMLGENTPSAPS